MRSLILRSRASFLGPLVGMRLATSGRRATFGGWCRCADARTGNDHAKDRRRAEDSANQIGQNPNLILCDRSPVKSVVGASCAKVETQRA